MTKATEGRASAAPGREDEAGYMLLGLLLVATLMMIAAAAAAPSLALRLKRDREEELIHRGVQYSRAIRRFAKSTGRFPVTLEQLRGTGGVRYIRKLYKDPITGSDFQLLHQGDITPPANVSGNDPGQNGENENSGTVTAAGDPNSTDDQGSSSAANSKSGTNGDRPAVTQNDSRTNLTGQVIFGVASKSKALTVREFSHKNRYNQWLFFYDPTRDRGAEIKGPTPLNSPTTLPVQAKAD